MTVSRGERRPLTRDRVLEAAMELADAEGLEALSMRRLAKELGVEAMSLYGHVLNKHDILAGMLNRATSEIELPGDDVDWKTAVRRNVTSDRDMRVRHRWVSSLAIQQQGGGTAQLRRGDWLLRKLREGGFSERLVYDAFHVLEAYVLGYAGLQLSFPYRGEELAGKARGFLDSIPSEKYPDLVLHIERHLEPHEGEGGFELGLDLILDGLERIRDAE